MAKTVVENVRNSLSSTMTTSNSGSKFEIDFDYTYNDKGIKELVPVGKTNVYEKIQSYKDDNNIYKILNRVLQGDYSQLDTNQGIFLDTTKIPKTINEYNQYVEECKSQFKSLEPRLKELFKNDYQRFIHTLETGEFDSIYNQYLIEQKGIENVNNNNINVTVNEKSEVKANENE